MSSTTETTAVIDAMKLRQTAGQFATGVTVVTYEYEGENFGATVNSFTSVSLEPPLVLVSMMNNSRAAQMLGDRPFAINILRHDQHAVAMQFAGKPIDPDSVAWVDDAIAPRLDRTVGHFVCEPWEIYPAGDHVLVLGRVVSVDSEPDHALTFHQGRFGNTAALAA